LYQEAKSVSKKKKGQKKTAQSMVALKANGLKAFQIGNYNKAIAVWENIPPAMQPAAALAEAYFRRGMKQFYGAASPAGLNDLKRAAAYQPLDACYAFHLGLALHHSGDLAGALTIYSSVRQSRGPFAARAAYPLALALLQSGQNPAADPVWDNLPPAEQARLQMASAFRRRPYSLQPEAARLWRALVAFDSGDHAQAKAGLDQALAAQLPDAEKGLALFYRGALAAQNEDLEAASRDWSAAYAAGLRSPRLQGNLAEIYQRIAEDLLSQGDAQTALAAVQEAKRRYPGNESLAELLAQIYQQLGYQAASANQWEAAQTNWRTAVELDQSSFRLAYNLALAYERAEDFAAAGKAWREALRRRPRRADHPEALGDEQVARLWQRAAECYHKAGDFEETGRTYQQAVKWAPENLDLRLALAESMLNDGRLIAARNELERLLKQNPQHVPALLRMGEVHFRNEDEQWWIKAQAKVYWDKAFALQPDNPQVRQAMAEWYLDQAEIDHSWNRFTEAIEDYQKALEFQPDRFQTLAYIAECYLELGKEEKGRETLEYTLARAASVNEFAIIIGVWLRLNRHDQAWKILAQAEARLGQMPTGFYIAMASDLLENRLKEQANLWLQRAIEKAAPEEDVLVMIGEMAMEFDLPLAREYLLKAIGAGQMPGQANLLLGAIEKKLGNPRASKKHLAEAERIAFQTKDQDLAERVEMARLLAGGPQAFIRRLAEMGSPEAAEKLLNNFLDMEFDDE
jgi:tetratricopeptide (TPR) repeat protein